MTQCRTRWRPAASCSCSPSSPSGYHLTAEEARAAALPASSPVLERWARLLRPDAVLVVGFAEASDDGIYNSAAVLAGHGVFAVYRKTHLWDAEKDVFTPGQVAAGVLETPVGPLGTLLCYDLEFPEMPRRLALAGAEILAVPTNWPVVSTLRANIRPRWCRLWLRPERRRW